MGSCCSSDLSLHRAGCVLTEILCCCIWLYKIGNYTSDSKTVFIFITLYLERGKKKLRVKDTVNLFKIDSEEILGYLQTT